jgi:hypothetical protein
VTPKLRVGVDDQARTHEVSIVRVAGGSSASLDLQDDLEVRVEAIDLYAQARRR